MAKTNILVLTKMSRRRLQNVLWRRIIKANIFVLKTSFEDEDERRLHQDECLLGNDAWTPLLVNKLGYSVKVKSMQEELFLWICVGSLIIWWKPFDVLNEKSFVPSAESMSLDHQEMPDRR